MTKKEKIESLKSILSKAKPVVTKKDNVITKLNFGFRPEIINVPPTNADIEITFENVDEAVSVIRESNHVTNMTEIEMKNDLLKLCHESNIDCNNDFTIRFLTT